MSGSNFAAGSVARRGGAHEWLRVCRRAAARYFLLQGIAGLAWWALLWLVPESRGWFVPPAFASAWLGALAVADVVLYAGGSLAAALVCMLAPRAAPIAAALVAGITGYALLLALGLSVVSGTGWLGTIAMTLSMLASVLCLVLVAAGHGVSRVFRESRPRAAAALALRSAMQAAVFWTVLLLIAPWTLHVLERRAGVPTWDVPPLARALGVGLFGAASVLGVRTGLQMAFAGRGTPLPTASATRLVSSGVYGVVRNPMAIAGLTQGAAVALVLGSPSTLTYVVLGGLTWEALVRPLEEHDLRVRFGAAYDEYCARVRCWVPFLGSTGRSA